MKFVTVSAGIGSTKAIDRATSGSRFAEDTAITDPISRVVDAARPTTAAINPDPYSMRLPITGLESNQ
jgi:hypothetical protein